MFIVGLPITSKGITSLVIALTTSTLISLELPSASLRSERSKRKSKSTFACATQFSQLLENVTDFLHHPLVFMVKNKGTCWVFLGDVEFVLELLGHFLTSQGAKSQNLRKKKMKIKTTKAQYDIKS